MKRKILRFAQNDNKGGVILSAAKDLKKHPCIGRGVFLIRFYMLQILKTKDRNLCSRIRH